MSGEKIIITDVSPRDGLQNQATHVSTALKLELIRRLATAGVSSIEASSFVSPSAVPQMSDAAQLLAMLRADNLPARISVLVPNQKGLERAAAAGATEIAVVLSASDTMNRKNINMDLALAIAASSQTLKNAAALHLKTRAYIAVAFSCPFEGPTPLSRVVELSALMHEAGAGEVVIADTIGSASPADVKERMKLVAQQVPLKQIGAHFHDTRGMAVANAWAALEAGVRRFDASVGGIGGCPFAPGAAGNLATEDLVLMAESAGFDSGISISGLMPVIAFAEGVLGKPLGGRSAAWLRRQYPINQLNPGEQDA
jgi:hydroxymethylglutaryl-CoA lyase